MFCCSPGCVFSGRPRPPGCKAQRRFANRASRRCGGSLPVVLSGAIHLFKPLSPGADTATTCRTDCPG
ncbi:hypothetical protein EA431_24940 [Escherichia coli]|nr:hypothetical protein EA431_24940 [Escherichia coli]